MEDSIFCITEMFIMFGTERTIWKFTPTGTYRKVSDQKKVQITTGLSCNIPISTHYFVDFIILSYDTVSWNKRECNEENILRNPRS